MAKNIEISLVSNTRDFVKGTANAAAALDDVAGSLDDLARDAQQDGRRVEDALDGIGDEAKRQGDRAGDAIADGIEDGTREAESEIERLNRTFRELATEARTQSKKAGDDIDDNVGRGAGKAREAVGEFKDEARANFSEVTSSFDGSMDSIVDLAQGTLGGLAGSLAGPIGLVAGGLAAAGGALAGSIIAGAEASEQRVSDMYDDMAESGQRFLSTQYLQQEAQRIIQERFGDIEEAAKLLEVPAATVAAAYAGHAESLAEVRARADEVAEREAERASLTDDVNSKASTNLAIIGKIRGEVGSVTAGTSDAVRKFDLLNQTANRIGAPLGDAEARARGIADQVARIPAARDVRVNVDTEPLNALERRLQRGIEAPILLRPPAAGRVSIQ